MRVCAVAVLISVAPNVNNIWGISSIGRVRRSQRRGSGIEARILHFCLPLPGQKFLTQRLVNAKKVRGWGGIEPPTSRTLNENHTTRPLPRHCLKSFLYSIQGVIHLFLASIWSKCGVPVLRKKFFFNK